MKVKALYSVGELAELAGMHECTLRRWIKAEKLTVVRRGRSVKIPLAGFRDQFPQLWAAICVHYRMKPSSCEACGAPIAPASDMRTRRASDDN